MRRKPLKVMKVMPIFGTRPETIKMAPVIKELERRPEFEVVVCVTAQHRQMLDQFLDFFGISPRWDLNIMQEGQTLTEITHRALVGIETVLKREKPDLILVQGDTTTTFAAALEAFYQKIPSAHIEAGLRTYDKFNPYPEEINRRLVSAVADLHFPPTPRAKEALLKEKVPPNSIFVTGNTVVDALQWVIQKSPNHPVTQSSDHSLTRSPSHRLILATAHRRENWGKPLRSICRALRRVIEAFPDACLVFPVHKNRFVREVVSDELDGRERIEVAEPPDYFDFVQLMRRAYVIVTDSGGVQEEAPSLGVPVLVMRKVTERPEGVEAGVVKLIGTDEERIFSEVSLLLSDALEHAKMSRAVNPYGDGKAAPRIAQAILHHFGFSKERPEEFYPTLRGG